MHGLETSQLLTAAGAVIVFLGGIVLAGVRSTISRLKKDSEQLRKDLDDLHLEFVALKSEHDIYCENSHGKRRH